MTQDFGELSHEFRNDDAMSRRLAPAPKLNRSPSAQYLPMERLLSSADCRLLQSQGKSVFEIAKFRITRAAQMRRFAASLSRSVRKDLIDLVAHGAEADTAAASRIAISLAVARLNLFAAAFAFGFDVEAPARLQLSQTFKRYLSAEIVPFPQTLNR